MNKSFYNIIILLIQIVHVIYIVFAVVAMPLLVIYEPFWIWVPVNSWMVHHIMMVNKNNCPLTHLENIVRKKANRPTVNTFTESIIGRKEIIKNSIYV